MRAVDIFASVALIVALGYIEVSWAVAEARVVRVLRPWLRAGLLVANAHEASLRITDAKSEMRSKDDQVRAVLALFSPGSPRCRFCRGLLREAAGGWPLTRPRTLFKRGCKGRSLAYLLAQMPAQLSSVRNAPLWLTLDSGAGALSRPMRPRFLMHRGGFVRGRGTW
jgi:hypothetical protein